MSISRNQQHYVIMTVIYNELTDFIYGDGKNVRDARLLMSELAEEDYDQIDDYVKDCVTASLKNYGAIIEAYKPLLKDWKWERIPLLTQAILIMSYAHFYYVEKVDKKIVINTAVALGKKYIEEKQAKFINAILDGALK